MLTTKTKFNIALIFSLAVHLVVLTVLFVPKPKDADIKFTELKIKFGSNKDTHAEGGGSAGIIVSPAQTASTLAATAEAQAPKEKSENIEGKVVYKGEIKEDQIAAVEKTQEEVKPQEAKPAPEPEIVHKDAEPVREEVKQPEIVATQVEPKKIIAVEQSASKKMVVPAQDTFKVPPKPVRKSNKRDASGDADEYDSYMEPDEDYTVLGNSRDKDAVALVSYEQMLPLWLDKFRGYPDQARVLGIEGSGDVFIKINRSGKILLSSIIKSTGYQVLDDALVQMLKQADPVVPVPADYHRDKKTFSYRIRFEFAKDGGS